MLVQEEQEASSRGKRRQAHKQGEGESSTIGSHLEEKKGHGFGTDLAQSPPNYNERLCQICAKIAAPTAPHLGKLG